MICKKCGYNIEEGWKYCPNCSSRINKKTNIIILIIILIVISCFLFFIIRNNLTLNVNSIEKKLEEKYNENFTNVSLIKSIKNKDVDINCDGSSFGTIKGRGTIEYYKLYSPKNDIEFFAFYDTSNKLKGVNDTYENYLSARKAISDAYNITYKYFSNYIDKIVLTDSFDTIQLNINSSKQLYDILSHVDNIEKNLSSYNNPIYYIRIYINQDLFNFCKENYENLTILNNEIVKLTEEYNFELSIYLNNDTSIILNRLNEKAYVYDRFGNDMAWGELLDDFVQRENY